MSAAPPYWEVKGRHEGLEFDLKMTGTAPTSFYRGDYAGLLTGKSKSVNLDQFTSCTGTITVGKKTYDIVEGQGCHEHPVSTVSLASGYQQPQHWFVGGDKRVRFFYITQGANHYGRVLVDGRYLTFDNSAVTLDILDWWHDPRSTATIPSRWHVTMRSPEGTFDIHAAASGRANRVHARRNGYVLDVWILGAFSGSFQYADGRMIPLKDVLFEVEWTRTIWP